MNNSYLKIALKSIPRILTCMDRNIHSSTYGCMHRDFWMYKTSDFPDAVRQFGIHALALVYSNKFCESNIYYNNKKILEYIKAGLIFWTKIQHKDGSFDEFYPNERGWVGPTAFTTYTSIESYKLVKNHLHKSEQNIIENAIKKSSHFISKGDQELDFLANHHAMATLALWKAYDLFKNETFLNGYKQSLKKFKSYHIFDEGWSTEYDGIDPGYLSATVSFLGKIYKSNKDPQIHEICKSSINTCSYFFYPNGYYGGFLGSRNTQHVYSHGFEIFSNDLKIANRISIEIRKNYDDYKYVIPEIMSDRYLFYRVPELLLSHLESMNNSDSSELKLPYEEEKFTKYFKKAKVWIYNDSTNYFCANLAKGGAYILFNKKDKKIIDADAGIYLRLKNKKILSSQWISQNYAIETNESNFIVRGKLQITPGNKTFNQFTNLIFRMFLLIINLFPQLSHKLKGFIRKLIVLGSKETKINFIRKVTIKDGELEINNFLDKLDKNKIHDIQIGDIFYNRFVPQSQFFQNYEIEENNKKSLLNNDFEIKNEQVKFIKSFKL